jgi:hypothetical protein
LALHDQLTGLWHVTLDLLSKDFFVLQKHEAGALGGFGVPASASWRYIASERSYWPARCAG